ncbi:hypothetical protein FQN50_006897 [Emmonsiellopsis sp. PD_5]|nr:hypothetical protein FQN50_006897 [Emmonsiellopsis sp. PD_5]
MHLSTLLPLSLLPLLAAAHFDLTTPKSRGSNHDSQSEFPCGGASPSKRTSLSLDDPQLSIAVKMGHDQNAVQVLLALGTDPGTNFNITLLDTFRQAGLGDFCFPPIKLTEELLGTPLTEGMNATLQVVTNGDPTGGLYNCADLTFASITTLTVPTTCKNGTGVTAKPFSGEAAARNANESTPNGQAQSGGSDPESPSSTGAAMPLQTAAWGVMGAAVLGGVALL